MTNPKQQTTNPIPNGIYYIYPNKQTLNLKSQKKILLCFVTCPEAIKMTPIYHELKKWDLDFEVCITGQHHEMLDQVLRFFEIVPDY